MSMHHYPSPFAHDARKAVPGPYHVVQRDDSADVLALERALLVGLNPNGSVTLSADAVDALQRILAEYRSELVISGAPDRLVTNPETTLAAVEALNRATG